MKKVFGFLVLLFFLNCSENGPDCFKSQGELETQEISVDYFTKIHISDGIDLVVKQAEIQSVLLEMGDKLIDDIKFEVVEGELKITNENGCEMLRNYHSAKVYITTPELVKIYSASQYSIKSDGILRFPDLTLESGIVEDTPSSIFEMQIENEILRVNDNISSVFKISGTTNKLEINFWGSNGRFEGENLITNEVLVNHRSTNDIIVYPIQAVRGVIRSTGNLVLKNLPPIVEVEELYSGEIIFP